MKPSAWFRTAATVLIVLTGAPSIAVAETVNCMPITGVPTTITAQGVYCFTEHITTNMSTGVAIQIAANNVVLDLNGYKLQGTSAGSATAAVGIASSAQRNTTIRNGNVRGFLVGVALLGGAANIVEDLRLDLNTVGAIRVTGVGNLIRNNIIVSTGGSSSFPNANPVGISAGGSLARVMNNDILDMRPNADRTIPGSFGSAIRVELASEGVIVEGNRMGKSWLTDPFSAVGIEVDEGALNALLINTRFTRMSSSIACSSDSTGKYRDNISIGSGPYSGCTDAGNNQ